MAGESTRPMAEEVSETEEVQRVAYLWLKPYKNVLIVGFQWIPKAIAMQEAAKVGMDLINDIRALREPRCT